MDGCHSLCSRQSCRIAMLEMPHSGYTRSMPPSLPRSSVIGGLVSAQCMFRFKKKMFVTFSHLFPEGCRHSHISSGTQDGRSIQVLIYVLLRIFSLCRTICSGTTFGKSCVPGCWPRGYSLCCLPGIGQPANSDCVSAGAGHILNGLVLRSRVDRDTVCM